MTGVIYAGLLLQLVLAGTGRGSDDFITIERLSPRVVLAYWVGTDRRCNLTAIQSQKGLVIIDTEMSPRIMAPIKAKIERVFGRNDCGSSAGRRSPTSSAGSSIAPPSS